MAQFTFPSLDNSASATAAFTQARDDDNDISHQQDDEPINEISSESCHIDCLRIIHYPRSRSSPQWVMCESTFVDPFGRTVPAAAKVYFREHNAPLARYEAEFHAAASQQNPHLVRLLAVSTYDDPKTNETLTVHLLEKPTTTLALAMKRGTFSIFTIRRLTHQILECIEICHSNGECVQNLATSNIFIINNDAKIASLLPDINTIEIRPPEYFGPKVVPTRAADIFSFGLLLLRLLAPEGFSKIDFAYPPDDLDSYIDEIFIDENSQRQDDDQSRRVLLEMCQKCLRYNPTERPCAEALRQTLAHEIEKAGETRDEIIVGSPNQFNFHVKVNDDEQDDDDDDDEDNSYGGNDGDDDESGSGGKLG